MTDWGTGATSRSKTDAPVRPDYRFADCVCSQCGRVWMFRYLYDSDLKQVRDEHGNILCKSCREKRPKRMPTPPPKKLQITIDEVLGLKK